MPLRHFPPHSSCFARFSKMGGPIFVSPHRTHCTTPLSQASSSSSAYRPAIILLGLRNNLGDHQELVQTLNDKYGVPTVLAKVSRIDWLRNAAGLVDPNYWHGTQIGSDTAKNDFSVNKVQVQLYP